MGESHLIYCMKRILTIALCLAASLSAFAQTKDYNFDLAAFSAVNISDEFVATISAGESNSLILTVDEVLRDYVSINVKNGQLNVSVDSKNIPSDVRKMYKGKNTPTPTYKVNIVASQPVSTINLKNKSSLEGASGVLASDSFTLNLSDNAKVATLAVESTEVILNLSGKADAGVDARCESLSVNQSGASSLKLSATAKKGVVNVSGASDIVSDGIILDLDFSIKGTSKAVLNGTSDNAAFTCAGTTITNAVNFAVTNASVLMSGMCSLTEAASSKLKVELSGGSTLVFDNDPAIEIVSVKSATLTHYGK